jgi:SnoaL-like domain
MLFSAATTMSTSPESLLDSADVTAVTQLIVRERESRDLGFWDRMRSCFWPDSHVRVSWFRGNGADFVTGSIDMAKRGVPAKHRLGPALVTLNELRAVATMSAIIDLPVTINGVEGCLSSYTRFLYRAEKRSNRWGIISFDAQYVRDEIIPSVPGQIISIDPKDLAPLRSTYRLLWYYLKLQGYSIDPLLAGDDRPDLCASMNKELFDWLGLPVPS